MDERLIAVRLKFSQTQPLLATRNKQALNPDCWYCTFSGVAIPGWDDDSAATHLYRIAHEAANDAIKHVSAKHIRISLEIGGQHATLKVVGDGVGIQDQAAASHRAGLRIMRYHADLINAVFSIDPARGRRHRVDLHIYNGSASWARARRQRPQINRRPRC